MKFTFGLQHPLTCKPLNNLSNPCNKVRGEYFSKDVLPASLSCVFLPASLSLCRCGWLYNISRRTERHYILMFSNRSFKLFTLINRFLITVKALHSIRMCLAVQVVWQVKHCCCGSCFRMKEWVSLVWPIRNRDIMTCSLIDFLDAALNSIKFGGIWKSLLWMLLLHRCCHFVRRMLVGWLGFMAYQPL